MRLYQRFLPYGVAIGSTATALLLTLWLEPLLSRTIGAFFYIAIHLSAWYGGFRAGSVVVVLSLLAIDYFFLPPRHHLFLHSPEDVLRLGLFLMVALVINLLTSNFQESKKKIERLNQQLILKNAEQITLALSAARMGMWDWNLVTGELNWSPETEQLFGFASGTFDGKYETFDACIHPDDRQGLKQVTQQALQTKSIYHHEYRVIWRDGSIHWLEGRGHGFYDPTGQAVRMTGTVMNIDDRKQTEALLHQQFEQQRLLMQMTQRIRKSLNLQEILQTTVEEMRGFLQCDRVIVFQFSPGWAGKVVVESVAADWMALVPLQIYDPCVGEEYVEPFKQGLVTAKSDIYQANLSPCHIEFLANLQVRANLVAPILIGDELWGLVAAHHCAAPRPWQDAEIDLLRQVAIQAGIAIQQADLFEQVQKEVLRIQSLFNTSFDGIVILDREGKVLEANPRFAEMLGYTPEETASLSIFDWDAHFTSEELQQLMRDFINLKTGGFETQHRRKNGSIYDVEISASVVEWQGEILTFCVCRDITDRKQAEVALQQLNAELEQRVIERTAALTEVNDRLLVTLREKEQAYQLLEEQAQLLDLAHDSIITWDLNSVITFWNQGAEFMYGWKKAEALGQEIQSLLKTQFPQSLAEIKAELFEKGYWEGELIHFTKDNRQITVASRQVVQKDEAGQPIKVLGINNDITQQKQTELALQQSSREIEDLYNNAPCGYHSLDAEGTIVRINNTELNWLGYTRNEVLFKKKFIDFITPDTKQVFYDCFPLFKQHGWIENLEYKLICKDGSTKWLNLNASAIKDDAGNFLMSRSTLFDISDRKRVEKALRDSEEKFRQLAENIQAVFWMTDFQSRQILYVSNAYETVWQSKCEDVYQNFSVWLEAVHPDDLPLVEAALIQQGKTGESDTEYRIIRPDGSMRWIRDRAFGIRDETGEMIRIIGIAEDITERKRAEKILQQYERIISNTLDGITLLDRNYIYQIANPSYLFWCNKSENEVIGNSVINISDQELFDTLIHSRLERCLNGEIIRYEKWFHHPNLMPQFMSVTYTPYRDVDDTISGVIVSLRDLTRLKQAEESLQESESILRSFFNSGSMMMGIVEIYPHDIFHLSSNLAATQFFGTTPEAMQNRFASELGVPPDFIQMWLNFYREAEQSGGPVKFEYKHQTATIQKWLSATTCPIINSSSSRPRFSFIVEDISERKHAEQIRELQAAIARNMAEGVCLVRTDNGIIVHANPKFEQMFGYDFGELNDRHVSILNYATESLSAEDVTQAIRSSVLQRGESTYEVHNVKKDGTPFWCRATCSIFKHPDYGDILLAVHQDITDRKQAEATLRQQARQENLLWCVTQAIRQSLDLNAILNTAVREVRQTLQVDRATVYRFNPDWSGDFVVESVTPNWVKLVEPNVEKVWEDTYLQETQGGRFQNHETFVVEDIYNADLQPCHIELLEQFQAKAYTIVPLFSGESLWGLLAIYQNATPRHWQAWEVELLEQIASQLAIAIQQSELYTQLQLELQERKQATAVIREAERRWRSLLDNVQLIVVGLDLSGNVNYINSFFLRITGYTQAEILGQNWFKKFLPPSMQQSSQTVFSEILTHNAHPYYRNIILTKSGEERFVAWNNTMLQDAEGRTIGTISIGEDITEQQKLEQIKNEFIGIVSHELRTPLTAIQMSLGLLKTGIYDKKPEKARRMIEIALIDTNRLVNLVNDILDLERLESGRAFLEKTVCKAQDLMQQAIDGIQAIATQQQITIALTPTDAEVWATTDAIIQTLTNLLSNALKFSPPHSQIHLSATHQTGYVLFQVSDRGRGIPADKLEAIFGRFQQVDASDSREKGGTGLGLAICRSIIERHGGKIWADSVVGAGSTFFFTLPLPSEHIL
ncbi:MAG: PAS domain S-box protein [Actinomycetota bacterium]